MASEIAKLLKRRQLDIFIHTNVWPNSFTFGFTVFVPK